MQRTREQQCDDLFNVRKNMKLNLIRSKQMRSKNALPSLESQILTVIMIQDCECFVDNMDIVIGAYQFSSDAIIIRC